MNLRRATQSDLGAITGLQHRAYAANRIILGVEPLPLLADYGEILATMEVYLAQGMDEHGLATLNGVLILEPRAEDLLIWSIATEPGRQSAGFGRGMLAWAEVRARELGRDTMRLYTGTLLADRVAWYARHGYATERVEQLPDRSATHMVKRLAAV